MYDFSFERTELEPGRIKIIGLTCTVDGEVLKEDLYMHDATHDEDDDPETWSVLSEKYVARMVMRHALVMVTEAAREKSAPASPFANGGKFSVEPEADPSAAVELMGVRLEAAGEPLKLAR